MNDGRGDDHRNGPAAPADPVAAPRWFELGVLAAAGGLAAVGVVGLALAVVGRYSTVVTLAVAIPLLVAALGWAARALPVARTSRSAVAAAGAALVVAAAFGAFAGATPSQNVLVDRDPGSYTNTARALVDDGTLEVDARGTAFAGVDGLSFTSQAVYDVGRPVASETSGPQPSGRIEFQFNHLTSVVMAAAYDVGGVPLMFRLPALVSAAGLAAVYAVAVRATGRPWAALVAPTLLALALPVLYVARNTYSEPFTALPLWAAMATLAAFHQRPRAALAVVGGALAGATVCARVDALAYLALAVPLAGISVSVAGPRRARARGWALAAVAATVPAALGLFDLTARTGAYVDDLADQVALLRLGGVAVVVATAAAVAAWWRWPALRHRARRVQRPAAVVAAAVVAVAAAAAWLVRPRVQTGRLDDPIELIGVLQRRDGLPVDASASYAEDSLRWMAWYLGAPALALAIAAAAWLTYRAVRGRVEPAALAVLVLCVGGGGLYWWQPSITPDQLWATRRFAPAAIPALAVLVSVGVAVAARASARLEGGRVAAVAKPVAAAAGLAILLVPAARATAPVRGHTMQQGFVLPVVQLCDQLPDDAAVVVVGPSARQILQQGVRSWCGVPTAGVAAPLNANELAAMAATVADNGHRLHLVSRDVRGITDVTGEPAPPIGSTDLAVNDTIAMATLDRPPTDYGGEFGLQLFVAPVDPG